MNTISKEDRIEIASIMIAMLVDTPDDAESMGYGIEDEAYGTHSPAELKAERARYDRLSAMIPANVKASLYAGEDLIANLIANHLEEVFDERNL